MSNMVLREAPGAVRDGHDFRLCSECGREYDALAGKCPFCAEGQPATFRHKPGTAPDTSLNLGEKRRAWLISNGGIQPMIKRLIDEAIAQKGNSMDPEEQAVIEAIDAIIEQQSEEPDIYSGDSPEVSPEDHAYITA